MKKIFLTFILLTSLTFGQSDLLLLFSGGELGWGVALDGSTESAAVTPFYLTTNLGSELCSNTNFETNTSGWIVGGTGTITRITSDFHSGIACAECVTNAGTNYIQTTCQVSPSSGTTITKSITTFWAKSVSGGAIIKQQNGGVIVMVNGVITDQITLTAEWAYYVVISTYNSDTSYNLQFYTTTSGTWRIDDVSVKRVTNTIDLEDRNLLIYDQDITLYSTIGHWITGGTHVPTRSTVDKKTGSGSMLITSTGVGDATTNFVSLPAVNLETIVAGHSYKIQYEARVTTGGTTVTAVLGSKSATLTGISSTLGTFTKGIYNFTATASEVGVPLKLYLSAADLVYIDNISITETYPLEIEAWFKTSTTGAIQTILSRQTSTTTSSAYGFLLSIRGTNNLAFQLYDASGSNKSVSGAITVTDGIWKRVKVTFEPVTGVLNLYINNVLDATATINLGRSNNTQNLSVGKYSYNASNYFNGQLGNVYVKINGETRAYYKWKGSTNAAFLDDWSNFLNDLTGTAVTTADQIRGVSPYVLD